MPKDWYDSSWDTFLDQDRIKLDIYFYLSWYWEPDGVGGYIYGSRNWHMSNHNDWQPDAYGNRLSLLDLSIPSFDGSLSAAVLTATLGISDETLANRIIPAFTDSTSSKTWNVDWPCGLTVVQYDTNNVWQAEWNVWSGRTEGIEIEDSVQQTRLIVAATHTGAATLHVPSAQTYTPETQRVRWSVSTPIEQYTDDAGFDFAYGLQDYREFWIRRGQRRAERRKKRKRGTRGD